MDRARRDLDVKDREDLALMVELGLFDAEVAVRPFAKTPRLQADASHGRGDFGPESAGPQASAGEPLPQLPSSWREP